GWFTGGGLVRRTFSILLLLLALPAIASAQTVAGYVVKYGGTVLSPIIGSTLESFTQPAVNGSVTVCISNASDMFVGRNVKISDVGFYKVSSIPAVKCAFITLPSGPFATGKTVMLVNLGLSDNVPEGTVINPVKAFILSSVPGTTSCFFDPNEQI